jgi:hypothetical protein
VRRTIESYRVNGVLGPASLLLILVPGIYMATTAWAWQPWLQVSFGALLLIIVLGGAVTRRKLGALATSLQGDDRSLTLDQERQIRDPLLRTSFVVRALLSLGIVALMSTKPDLSTSLLVIGVALGLAAIISTAVLACGTARATVHVEASQGRAPGHSSALLITMKWQGWLARSGSANGRSSVFTYPNFS